MSTRKPGLRSRSPLMLAAVVLAATSTNAATRTIDQHQSADPTGTVEIINVAGSVDVLGWDKPEVEVSGQIGDRVERVEITGSDKHLTVRVVLPMGSHWSGDGEAQLTVHVPKASSLTASLVSADFKVSGVSGAEQVHTVSGQVITDGGGHQRVNTISGNIQIGVPPGTPAEVSTISGEVVVRGADGEVSVKSVSGGGKLELGSLSNFRLETISGDFTVTAKLAPAAHFEASAVSGDIRTDFSGAPGATFDLSTLSGTIKNCSDAKPTDTRFGPGSKLSFSTGDGKSSVEISSKSGDLDLCSK